MHLQYWYQSFASQLVASWNNYAEHYWGMSLEDICYKKAAILGNRKYKAYVIALFTTYKYKI